MPTQYEVTRKIRIGAAAEEAFVRYASDPADEWVFTLSNQPHHLPDGTRLDILLSDGTVVTYAFDQLKYLWEHYRTQPYPIACRKSRAPLQLPGTAR